MRGSRKQHEVQYRQTELGAPTDGITRSRKRGRKKREMRKQIHMAVPTCSWKPHTSTKPRAGFTIVELLVVVSIIALLAALLIPAVFSAVRGATNAAIKMEVNQIEMALERYSQEMGEFPPDFSVTGKTEADTIALKRQAINNHLARKYRLRNGNLTYSYDSNGNAVGGDDLTDVEINQLNPTNALNFWLRGFSEDPQRPLTGPGTRDPYFDFDGKVAPPSKDRIDNDRDGQVDEADEAVAINALDPKPVIAVFASERDSFSRPILYYRGVTTAPNLPNEDGDQKAAYDDAVDWVVKANAGVTGPAIPGLTNPFPFPYWSSNLTRRINPKDINSAIERERIAPEKFQIISAGLDGIYGIGGEPQSALTNSNSDFGVYPEGSMRADDLDNITNFGQASTLEDTQ